MTVCQALKGEYRQIMDLFERLSKTSGRIGATRQRLLQLMNREVMALIQAEEEVLYCMLREVLPPDDARLLDLMEDHADLRERLWELQQTPPEDPRWLERLDAAEKVVRYHLKVETSDVFGPARRLLSEETSVALGQRLLTRKAEIEMSAMETESRSAADSSSRCVPGLLN